MLHRWTGGTWLHREEKKEEPTKFPTSKKKTFPNPNITSSMEDKQTKTNSKKKQKKHHRHPHRQEESTPQQPHKPSSTTAETSLATTQFKPSSEVKGLRFGTQFLVRAFTVRRAPSVELLRLLNVSPPTVPPPPLQIQQQDSTRNPNPTAAPAPFPSTTTFLPTNFTILAHSAWHTLTLGLGTKNSKAIVFVFDSPSTRSSVDRLWPTTIALGEVNRRLLRGLVGFEMARFKFRKGAITFYVFAVRKVGVSGFGCGADLKFLLESVMKVNDFLDHTAMLALPTQRNISFSPPVAMAH